MSFLRFDILHSIIALGFLGFFAYFGWRRNLKKRFDIAPKTYQESSWYAKIQRVGFFISILCLIIALFGPAWISPTDQLSLSGADIIFVVDTSKSMDAIDITSSPTNISRLDFTKKALAYFVQKYPQNRYGIVAFAGKSMIISPLTSDTQNSLMLIDSLNSNLIRDGGTKLEDAVDLAYGRFSNGTGAKSIVFLTDGGDPDDTIAWSTITKTMKQHTNIAL